MSFDNLERFRVLAGLPPLSADQRKTLTESWDDDDDNYGDDDDLSPAERDLVKKSDRDLKKKDVDVEGDLAKARAKDKKAADDAKKSKDADTKKEKSAEKGGETQQRHEADKKHDDADKERRKADDEQDRKSYERKKDERENEDDDKDDKDSDRGASVFGSMVKQNKDAVEDKPHVAAKKRGRTETERTGSFKTWVQSNPGATRAQAIAKAAELGMNARHANTKFYQFRKAVKEFWILVNPENAQVLGESSTGRAPIWVVYEFVEDLDAMIYESHEDALSAANKLSVFGHNVVLMHVDDSDE